MLRVPDRRLDVDPCCTNASRRVDILEFRRESDHPSEKEGSLDRPSDRQDLECLTAVSSILKYELGFLPIFHQTH
jgi:hypothetical protein